MIKLALKLVILYSFSYTLSFANSSLFVESIGCQKYFKKRVQNFSSYQRIISETSPFFGTVKGYHISESEVVYFYTEKDFFIFDLKTRSLITKVSADRYFSDIDYNDVNNGLILRDGNHVISFNLENNVIDQIFDLTPHIYDGGISKIKLNNDKTVDVLTSYNMIRIHSDFESFKIFEARRDSEFVKFLYVDEINKILIIEQNVKFGSPNPRIRVTSTVNLEFRLIGVRGSFRDIDNYEFSISPDGNLLTVVDKKVESFNNNLESRDYTDKYSLITNEWIMPKDWP